MDEPWPCPSCQEGLRFDKGSQSHSSSGRGWKSPRKSGNDTPAAGTVPGADEIQPLAPLQISPCSGALHVRFHSQGKGETVFFFGNTQKRRSGLSWRLQDAPGTCKPSRVCSYSCALTLTFKQTHLRTRFTLTLLEPTEQAFVSRRTLP